MCHVKNYFTEIMHWWFSADTHSCKHSSKINNFYLIIFFNLIQFSWFRTFTNTVMTMNAIINSCPQHNKVLSEESKMTMKWMISFQKSGICSVNIQGVCSNFHASILYLKEDISQKRHMEANKLQNIVESKLWY